MKQRHLGRTGLSVSEIGMGTMTFGTMADEAEGIRIMDRAFDAGVDFIDVAEIYPVPPDPRWAGRTEEICGKWLASKPRDAVVVATKVAGPLGGWFVGPVRAGKTALDRHHIERACEDSLRRLGIEHIDLYQTHWPDPAVPIEETLEALDRLIEAGKIRYAGCSNETAYGLTKSLWASDKHGLPRYETIQNNFSLMNRRFEDELSTVCRREGVSLLPYSPIGAGVLSLKYNDGAWPEEARFSRYRQDSERGKAMTQRFVNPRTLESAARFAEVAQECGLSPVTFAVAWTLSKDFVGSTLIGATRVEQMDELLGAAGVTLPREALAKCNAISTEIRYPMGL
jgi:aryl-alcohol dehydrogenase-like predicted oxidoreductase